jgi:hypothetical protein
MGGMVTACRTATAPSRTSVAPTQPAATPTQLTLTPTQATAPPTPVSNSVPELPLIPGQTWVHSSTEYTTLRTEGKIAEDEQGDYYYIEDAFGLKLITATFKITNTVVSTAVQNNYFVAQLSSEQAFVSATIDLDELATYGDINNYWGLLNSAATFWYVISGTQVFRQDFLDLTAVEDSFLEYVFPLSDFSGWYPDPGQRQAEAIGYAGHRMVDPGVGFVNISVPAGDFEDCALIFTGFNSGPVFQYFCSGIGVVSEKYDHRGSRFGYETVLTNFFIAEQ